VRLWLDENPPLAAAETAVPGRRAIGVLVDNAARAARSDQEPAVRGRFFLPEKLSKVIFPEELSLLIILHQIGGFRVLVKPTLEEVERTVVSVVKRVL
jgi:hypothetical protein